MNPPHTSRRRAKRGRSAITGAHLAALLLVGALAGCGVRELPPPEPTYADVEPVLRAACLGCHNDARAEGGYRVERYTTVIACPTDAGSAVEPPDTTAAILRVLERPDHAGLLSGREAALLAAWVAAGSPAGDSAMHAVGWVDPRSPAFHGRALRADRFKQMLDAESVGACAHCHQGTNGTIDRAMIPAAGATACTSCHQEAGGPTACSTCHGSAGHAYPPRDPCFHPEQAANAGGAHQRHAEMGFACITCHSDRTVEQLSDSTSEHGDGIVEVHLDPAIAGPDATYSSEGGAHTCSQTRCHSPNGSTAAPPDWFMGGPLGCSSCHLSPPANHYTGACNACHRDAGETGESRPNTPLHMNGVVDLINAPVTVDASGVRSAVCWACHGEGDATVGDPTPRSGSHMSHVHSRLSAPLECASCHDVPTNYADSGHLDRLPEPIVVEVNFGALASARGAMPTYSAGTCADVACHGSRLGAGAIGGGPLGGGGTYTTPHWGDTGGIAARCGSCHAIPPPPPLHPVNTNCSTVGCHGGYIAPGPMGPTLTPDGVAVHVNGAVDLWSGAAP